MMELLTTWVAAWGATDTPLLPVPGLMQHYQTLAWGLVLACLAAVLGGRLGLQVRRAMAVGLIGWVAMPGAYSPDYWLGLAFQSPSWAMVLLSALLLARRVGGRAAPEQSLSAVAWGLAVCGVVLGYVLMLDTFAVLPWQVYRLGFGPALLVLVTVVSLLPWVLDVPKPGQSVAVVLVPVAALLYAATRLPTGNVWDALLDPWLWLFLQGLLIRAGYRRLRQR